MCCLADGKPTEKEFVTTETREPAVTDEKQIQVPIATVTRAQSYRIPAVPLGVEATLLLPGQGDEYVSEPRRVSRTRCGFRSTPVDYAPRVIRVASQVRLIDRYWPNLP